MPQGEARILHFASSGENRRTTLAALAAIAARKTKKINRIVNQAGEHDPPARPTFVVARWTLGPGPGEMGVASNQKALTTQMPCFRASPSHWGARPRHDRCDAEAGFAGKLAEDSVRVPASLC